MMMYFLFVMISWDNLGESGNKFVFFGGAGVWEEFCIILGETLFHCCFFFCKWVVWDVFAMLLPHVCTRLIVGYYKLVLLVNEDCIVFFELGWQFLDISLYCMLVYRVYRGWEIILFLWSYFWSAFQVWNVFQRTIIIIVTILN